MKMRGKPQLRRSKRKAGLAKIDNDVGVFAAAKSAAHPNVLQVKLAKFCPGWGKILVNTVLKD